MRARDPHGNRWRVRRRWYAWRPRAMQLMQGPPMPEGHELALDRPQVYGGVLVPSPQAVFSLTGLPLAAAERLLLLLAMPVALALRALGLVPWTVVVRRGRATVAEMPVRGGAKARRVAAELVDAIEHGRPVTTDPA